ncbi:MAG TPA: hypothetical protein VKU02_04105 [Gemmataceae bacterium]|nr:hypothetical protein [Gemmataceae bacterium]
MAARELILLTPYRLPAQNSLMLASEDIAALLNGYSALWHPAALHGSVGPPRLASPYDYEQPIAGHVYAVPESPPLVLPEDWEDRVREAGALTFQAAEDRATTLANLLEALRSQPEQDGSAAPLLDLEQAKTRPFFGIGFGYVMVETLFEAMEHEKVLASSEYWHDVQAAVAALADPDVEVWRRLLQSAAGHLLSAREILYPVAIYLLDICIVNREHLRKPFPAAFDRGIPLNLVVLGSLLEELGQADPERLAALRQRVRTDSVEVCGGPYLERDDALLPIESQFWNLLKGLSTAKRLLDKEIQIFAGRGLAANPQWVLLLNSVGLRRTLLLPSDDAGLPDYRSVVTSLPSPDGKQVDAFTRIPYAAENPQTYFHWAHYLHKTIAQDHSATLALLHTAAPAAPWYEDLLELHRLGPVFGQWMTLSSFFREATAGEYVTSSGDEYHGDALGQRTTAHAEGPVSSFARHVRYRRRIDTVWTLAALSRGLRGRNDPLHLNARLQELEDRFEMTGADPLLDLEKVEHEAAEALAERLLARAEGDNPGFLLFNPCSFTRRVALELEGLSGTLPLTGPLKIYQTNGEKTQLVAEIPALGYAWIPARGTPGGKAPPARMRLADGKTVRNEFFEAEIDPATGGLRAFRDHRSRVNRLGQQLVFNPGSTMRALQIEITSAGPALGEIVSTGELVDEHERVLAHFCQRFRAWLGRPVLEIRIEITPQHAPQGYPWHAYYGARFAWRDERAALLRGVNGVGLVTSQTRPEAPDYLELRSGRQGTLLFPGGLPFHQRHGGRMLDIVLMPEGETEQVYEIGLALDREYAMQTALGMITPVPVLPLTKGPPHVGAAGWLFHLDAPNLVLSSFRPAPDGADAVIARMLECSGHMAQAELRCVRDPRRALLTDAQGALLMEANTSGDAVQFDVPAGDLMHLRIEFE